MTPFRNSGWVDFEAVKKAAGIVGVVESHGVALKKEGKDYIGLCPFHADRKPSLRVTPGKELWRCVGCGATGNVIQFVAKKAGVTEKEAARRLLAAVPGLRPAAQLEKKVLPAVPPQVAADLLHRVVNFYARTLTKDRAGLDYLTSRNLSSPALLENFRLGYCNGTLKNALPKSGELISQLQALGVLNAKGNEVFYGRVTVPIVDGDGVVVGLYGRKVEGDGARLPADSAPHIYLAGGHRAVFNAAAAKGAKRLIIVEAIFDALSLWQAGWTSVVPLYGKDGFTLHHETLLKENPPSEEIIVALDQDENGAGQKAALQLEEKLATTLPQCPARVIAWPDGMKDANKFFSSSRPDAARQFAAILDPVTAGEKTPAENPATETPRHEARENGFALVWSNRRYDVLGITQPNPTRLKATVKALGAEPGRCHVETLDLYSSRARRLYAAEAARLLRVSIEIAESDLGKILTAAERHAEQISTATLIVITEADRAEGMKLGRSPDLIACIQSDFVKLGLIGEERNALFMYLAMTSRKMDDPLAIQMLSSSGSGKSYTQDNVLSLCPEEDLIKLTSLSSQALFYKGEDSLRHKVLAVEEVAGAEGARYALRNLISAKKLTIETTVKNPLTGRMETQVNTVHGPTAVFETTTQPDTDPETKSRYILLSLDESPEQTRLILAAQRRGHTLDALVARKERAAIVRRHHAFQRLLRPLAVVNPFEPWLGYADDRLAMRRDQPKYLNLILAVTFLHQFQRPIKTHPVLGEYIEATLDDIAVANDLATELFGASLDDLSAPGRRLAGQLGDYVAKQAATKRHGWEKVEFSRRDLREALHWSDTRLRVHLYELVRLEYVQPLGGANGTAYRYRVLVAPSEMRSEGRFLSGLKSVEQLKKEAHLAGLTSHLAAKNGHPAGSNGHLAATPPHHNGGAQNGHSPSENGRHAPDLAAVRGGHIRPTVAHRA
ncbi:MAG: CHC2 zinc finger domain-containing protein [Opitutales bacterium]